jgi:hypothetical protein
MAPTRLKRNIDYLKVLSVAKAKQRKAIIKTADSDLITCLCECALNLLNGNLTITDKNLAKLNRFKTPIRQLVDKSVSQADKRKILEQKGGFLPALLVPVLGLAAQLLIDNLKRK